MSDTASSLEVVWSFVAVCGFVFSLMFLGLVYRSVEAVEHWILLQRARRWGPRHRFALIFFGSILILTLVWAGFIILGIVALKNPPSPLPDNQQASETAGWLLTLMESGLLLFEGLLLYAWVSARGAPIRRPATRPVRPRTRRWPSGPAGGWF